MMLSRVPITSEMVHGFVFNQILRIAEPYVRSVRKA